MVDDEFKRRMDGGVKIALAIDKIEKEGKKATLQIILDSLWVTNLDKEEILDILFSLTRQGTLILKHDDEIDVDVYHISL